MSEQSPDEVTIVVVRTGGIAGRRRLWQVDAAPDDAHVWVELIDQCPWDEPCSPASDGADRFVWLIRAHTPVVRREREVPDGDLTGPWRDLVEAVRDAGQG